MKVLVTQHIHDVADNDICTKQFIVESNLPTIREVFADYNKLEEGLDWVPDRWTTINEHGLFVTCPVCAESWVILDRQTSVVGTVELTGDECRAWRTRLHMTREMLARRSDISLSAIARFERFNCPVRHSTLIKIHAALQAAS